MSQRAFIWKYLQEVLSFISSSLGDTNQSEVIVLSSVTSLWLQMFFISSFMSLIYSSLFNVLITLFSIQIKYKLISILNGRCRTAAVCSSESRTSPSPSWSGTMNPGPAKATGLQPAGDTGNPEPPNWQEDKTQHSFLLIMMSLLLSLFLLSVIVVVVVVLVRGEK